MNNLKKIAYKIAGRFTEDEGSLKAERPSRSEWADWGKGSDKENQNITPSGDKVYYEKNRKKEIERSKEYKKNHPQETKEYQRKYHKDVYRDWHDDYRDKNRKTYNEYQKNLMKEKRKKDPSY